MYKARTDKFVLLQPPTNFDWTEELLAQILRSEDSRAESLQRFLVSELHDKICSIGFSIDDEWYTY